MNKVHVSEYINKLSTTELLIADEKDENSDENADANSLKRWKFDFFEGIRVCS